MSDTEKNSFSLKSITGRISMGTLIIGAFLILVLVLGSLNGIPFSMMLNDCITRFGRNGILVLAMVPAIQSGTGPNFALPLGIVCGLLAEVCAIEFGFTGLSWLLVASVMAIVVATIVGYAYGKLMNAVKGSEMTIATYVGFSACGLMSLMWLILPFKSSNMRWFIGTGLRPTIQLDAVGSNRLLDNFLGFHIGENIFIPTGMLLVFFVACFLVYLFFRSKAGIAISAGGANPMFAKAAGLHIDNNRILANIVSTVLAALGIIVYAQSFGFAQLYDGPLMMAFPAVAAVLIGGATAQRAKVFHVILGAFIFNSLLATAAPVANELFTAADLSDIMRKIIQNGIILYALTQVKGGGK